MAVSWGAIKTGEPPRACGTPRGKLGPLKPSRLVRGGFLRFVRSSGVGLRSGLTLAFVHD